MKIYTSLVAGMLCVSAGVYADAPAGYYSQCEGKSKGALKSQLYTIVKNHTPISYGSGSTGTWWAFESTDVHEDGYWWDIYTDARVSAANRAPSSMNIEHTFPKSWWGGAKNNAYKDIVHLMPVNAAANNLRSNLPYGEVGTEKSYKQDVPSPRFRYGEPVKGQGGGATYVFEPDDEYKGDIARTYFYMVTCYQDLSWSSSNNGQTMAAPGAYPTLQPWAMEMLLRWHRQDPVSQKERDRNDGLYEVQKNRNPFIDHPEMVEHIWGDRQDEGWMTGGTVDPDPGPDPDPEPGKAELTSPMQGDYFVYEGLHPGQTRMIEIPVLGSGFTHSLTASIEGSGAGLFSIMVGQMELKNLSISAADVMSADGYTLKVRYAPVTVSDGVDEAVLIIKSGELDEAVTVHLQGTCAEIAELAAPVALPAEQVSAQSYTVRWLKSAQDVDGYVVYRNVYNADGDAVADTFTYEADADEDSLVIVDRDESLRESYTVTATLGDAESPHSNEIVVDSTAGVSGIGADVDGVVRYFTTAGIELSGAPTQPGVHIVTVGQTVARTVVVK